MNECLSALVCGCKWCLKMTTQWRRRLRENDADDENFLNFPSTVKENDDAADDEAEVYDEIAYKHVKFK